MSNDEAEIRTLIDRWAEAVHAGDMDGVLADHTEDIVMFDVPPPERGARQGGLSRHMAALFQVAETRRRVRDRLARRHRRERCRLCTRTAPLRDRRGAQKDPETASV